MGINTSLALSNFIRQKYATFKSNQPNLFIRVAGLKLVFDSAHVKSEV